ncbi:hypothetical protein BDQ17DRAFT_1337525 [Cyathus striatus]|nr:hypothetical protein BDQ17DRAFT_1337525 [Cyathus striatus]
MGLLDPITSDGRIIFFLPWQGNGKGNAVDCAWTIGCCRSGSYATSSPSSTPARPLNPSLRAIDIMSEELGWGYRKHKKQIRAFLKSMSLDPGILLISPSTEPRGYPEKARVHYGELKLAF